jgi:hypothetical protein
MLRRALVTLVALSAVAAGGAAAHPAALKWPPWLSIESPVNPFDTSARDALFLVHASVHDGRTSIADLEGSAEGLVAGQRRTVPIHFVTTGRPDTYAVRREWPAEGQWLVRVTLRRNTTALVTLDRDGSVASVRVPTEMRGGVRIPRAVAAREVESMLLASAPRQ